MSNSCKKQQSTSATANNLHLNSVIKFPGLARQSNVDEKGKLLRVSSDSLTKVDNSGSSGVGGSSGRGSKGSMNSSFERFAASCDDAWDSRIEDRISLMNIDKNNFNSNANRFLKYGNRPAIHIKELSSQKECALPNNDADHSSTQVSSSSSSSPATTCSNNNQSNRPTEVHDPKVAKLKKLLHEDESTDLNELRKITWSGITDEERPLAWKLLLGCTPVLRSKRASAGQNKKIEYQKMVSQYYYNKQDNDDIYRQIHIDIPRMQPLISIFQQPIVQGIFERILYIWSIRHPASGYVQGMNDLVTPFFVTYLSEFVPGHSFVDVEKFDVSTLSDDTLNSIESDSYWSFNKLLDSIQDNYTFAQPGIQRLVNLLGRVMARMDEELHKHLLQNSVEYLQFAFRWMNNLLIREMPLHCIIRLWDTYLSEGTDTTSYPLSKNFSDSKEFNSWSMNSGTPFSSAFHLFVCAAFLRYWSKSLLQERDFQGLMLKLQNLPTFHWTEKEVKLLVADAYQLKCTFTPNHLKT